PSAWALCESLCFFTAAATTEIRTLSLHDALPIFGVLIEAGVEVGHLREVVRPGRVVVVCTGLGSQRLLDDAALYPIRGQIVLVEDRKSTRLNSSHVKISYAVFCLKKKKKRTEIST